jgi:hypothetical protein
LGVRRSASADCVAQSHTHGVADRQHLVAIDHGPESPIHAMLAIEVGKE